MELKTYLDLFVEYFEINDFFFIIFVLELSHLYYFYRVY